MSTQTITEFLEARIAEDEAVALGADHRDGGRWRHDPEYNCVWDGTGGAAASNVRPAANSRTGEHIARHDPARVLAECAAKRAIIGACLSIEKKKFDDNLWNIDEHDEILEALAAVYADHEDYDSGWAL